MNRVISFLLGLVAGVGVIYVVSLVQNILFRIARIEAFLTAVSQQ
jgi:hypothetical protein